MLIKDLVAVLSDKVAQASVLDYRPFANAPSSIVTLSDSSLIFRLSKNHMMMTINNAIASMTSLSI